jgi:hypothetical protein
MKNQPEYRSHLIPRTRDGWVAVVAFLGLLALAMPPVTHRFLNRLEPEILGLPFLYAVLLGIYLALIGVLIWTYRRRV